MVNSLILNDFLNKEIVLTSLSEKEASDSEVLNESNPDLKYECDKGSITYDVHLKMGFLDPLVTKFPYKIILLT